MSNFRQPLGGSKYFKADGAGTNLDPYVPYMAVEIDTVEVTDVGITTIDAGETHIGEVGISGTIVDVIFSLDDSGAYASGDVLAATQEIAGAVRIDEGTGVLQSFVLNDKDDQGVALYAVFLSANSSIGTENEAGSITDNNADNILGIVAVETADWIDLGGTRVVTKSNLGLKVKGASEDTSIYVGLITRGTPTHTTAGITGRFGFAHD